MRSNSYQRWKSAEQEARAAAADLVAALASPTQSASDTMFWRLWVARRRAQEAHFEWLVESETQSQLRVQQRRAMVRELCDTCRAPITMTAPATPAQQLEDGNAANR